MWLAAQNNNQSCFWVMKVASRVISCQLVFVSAQKLLCKESFASTIQKKMAVVVWGLSFFADGSSYRIILIVYFIIKDMNYQDLLQTQAAIHKQKQLNKQIDQQLEIEINRKKLIQELKVQESDSAISSQQSSMTASLSSAVSYDSDFIKSQLQRARAFIRKKAQTSGGFGSTNYRATVKFEQPTDISNFHHNWNQKQTQKRLIQQRKKPKQIELKQLKEQDLIDTLKHPFSIPDFIMEKEKYKNSIFQKQKIKQIRQKQEREQIRKEILQEKNKEQAKISGKNNFLIFQTTRLHIDDSGILCQQRMKKMKKLLGTLRKQQRHGDELLRTIKKI